MQQIHRFGPRLLGAAIAVTALIIPALASAQYAPPYAVGGQNQQIQGTIASVNGTWNITVADANGYNDSVELHQGTIINPTGLTLEPGMQVTIDGYADGSNFDAMEIDTPYQYSGPPPVAVYYGPGDWYPGYAYGWGPSFSLFFDFNSHRWDQRSFEYDGRVRRSEAPPSGWQDRPHGYIGNSGSNWNVRSANSPARRYEAPVTRSTYSAPSTLRSAWTPQQQQARSYSAPPQQARTYSAPQQQQPVRYSAPPQQARSYAAPPQQQQFRYSAPPQQQARTYSAPPQQARSYSAPAARQAPAARGDQGQNDRRHG